MKKILTIILVLNVLFLCNAANVLADDTDCKVNLISNGDFESSSVMTGTQASVIPNCVDVPSGWIPMTSTKTGLAIQEYGEENNALVLDHVINNWTGASQIIPTSKVASGIYNIKFRAKNETENGKCQLVCVLELVIKNSDGTCKRSSRVPYRTKAKGAENESQYIFELDDNEWHDFDFDVDLMFINSSGAYIPRTDIAAIELSFYQTFNGKSTLEAAKTAGSDLTACKVIVDDVTLYGPEMLEITNCDATIENVDLNDANIELNFNYDTQLYDSLENEITITDYQNNVVESTAEFGMGKINIMVDALNPDSVYTLQISGLSADTPVYDPDKKDENEKRYVPMINRYVIELTTKQSYDILDCNYQNGGITATVKSNIKDDTNALLVAYDNNFDGNKVYYFPIQLDANVNNEYDFSNITMSSTPDLKTFVLKKIDDDVDSTFEGEATMSVGISKTNECLSPSGKLSSDFYNKTVTVVVFMPDDDGNAQTAKNIDLTNNGVIDNKILAISQVKVNSDGSFSVPPISCNKGGDYRCIALVNDMVAAEDTEFFSSRFDNINFMNKINDTTGTVEERTLKVFDALTYENEHQIIRYDSEYYNKLATEADQKLVAECIVNEAPFNTIDDFEVAFKKNCVRINILKSNSVDILYNAIGGQYDDFSTNYVNELLKIQNLSALSTYGKYKELTVNEQKAVLSKFNNYVADIRTDIKTADDFIDLFNVSVLKYELENTLFQSDVSGVLNNHDDILSDVLFTKYNSLGTAQGDVNLKIKQLTGYSSVDEFTNKINNYINNAKSPSPSPSPSPGGNHSSTGNHHSSDSDIYIYTSTNTSNTSENTVNIVLKNRFNDLEDAVWASTAIEVLYEKGIINGISQSEFNPLGKIKREEIVKMIVLASGADLIDDEIPFNDVDKNAWYTPYITTAKKLGITNGIGNGDFGIGEYVSRQDMCVMSTYLINNETNLSEINDNILINHPDFESSSEYAQEDIKLLVNIGVLNGDEQGNLKPKDFLTRAEAAKIIYEIMKYSHLL